MVAFPQELVTLEPLKSETAEDGVRFYETPDGRKYPSVTTVLGAVSDKEEALAAWSDKIGSAEAVRITAQAGIRGNLIHDMMERYVLSEEVPSARAMPTTLMAWRALRPVLDKYLQKVMAVEVPLYSHRLRLAGRCDLIGTWAGKNAIIDYKTSLRPKKEEWIQDYFLQTTAYSLMFQELTNISVPGIVVVIYVDDEPKPQIFAKMRKDYIVPLLDAINRYHAL